MCNSLKALGLIFGSIMLSGCFILGIHTQVHNPKHAKKYPNFNEAEILFGALSTYRSCYDVHYYELDILVDPAKKELRGTVGIYATATAPFDTLQIDLYPNFTIEKIVAPTSGTVLQFVRKAGAVFVIMENTIQTGEPVALQVAYYGKPKEAKRPPWRGGFVWKKDKEKYPWVGVACESEGASVWWPCKDHSSDEADSVSMHYSVPSDIMAVGNGQLMGKQSDKDRPTYTTYHWKVTQPINTYNITFYAGNYALVNDSMEVQEGMLTMNHYVLKKNKELARRHFQQVKPILSFFETKFGSYPWFADGFRLVEAPYEGMEHQSAIAYGSGYKNFFSYDFDYIILHETAHEWWGNSVTAKDFADMWLQEGFATYAEALYVEHTRKKTDYINYLLFERLFIKNKRPVIGPEDRRYFSYKDTDVYMKGAWILHTFRHTLNNDSLFFEVVRSFAVNYRAKLVTTADFMNWVNEKTGTDYDWFFSYYLTQRQAPILEMTMKITGEEDQVQLFYRWKNAPSSFKLPCVISYEDEKGKVRKLRFIPKATTSTIVLEGMRTSKHVVRFDVMEKYYGFEEQKKLSIEN
jgi:aminopeptidase N